MNYLVHKITNTKSDCIFISRLEERVVVGKFLKFVIAWFIINIVVVLPYFPSYIFESIYFLNTLFVFYFVYLKGLFAKCFIVVILIIDIFGNEIVGILTLQYVVGIVLLLWLRVVTYQGGKYNSVAVYLFFIITMDSIKYLTYNLLGIEVNRISNFWLLAMLVLCFGIVYLLQYLGEYWGSGKYRRGRL
jgi:hypothetical protein